MKAKWTVIIIALAIAIGRIFITPRLNLLTSEGTYEAFAHLFVGFLVIVPFYDSKQTLGPSKLYGWIGWALAFFELGYWLVQKFHPLH
jgi:hypothetical protein